MKPGWSLIVFGTTLSLYALAISFLNRPLVKQDATKRVRLNLEFTPTWGTETLAIDDVRLKTKSGNLLSISRLAYLVSHIQLVRSDGTTLVLGDRVGYLNPAEKWNGIDLGQVPVGQYAALRFDVGLDPKTNHSDPAKFAASSPLNPLTNQLHWGWQGGFVFMAIEGHYESSGTQLGGFSYHIATDDHLMPVEVPMESTIALDSNLKIRFDVAKVFSGPESIVVTARQGQDSTHSGKGDLLATRLAKNISNAFSFDGRETKRTTLASRGQSVSVPKGTTAFRFKVPDLFPQPHLPIDNPLTVEGIALGKRLFFDKRLSANNTQSCASCHAPSHAFSDAGHPLSRGIDGKRGHRHAMSLVNLAWNGSYTWDGRRSRLRDQVLAPIQDSREMHQSLPETVAKITAAGYGTQFAKAFGSPGISADRIGRAVEQYLLTLISDDSRFDRALHGQVKFTDEEKQGLMLFITEYDPARGKIGADCFHCHGGNLFSDYRFTNNGLDSTFNDLGRAVVTGRAGDAGKFKTPSLRNVAIRGPFMHDGRFKTLEQVIDHYTTGVRRSDTLDPNIAKHPVSGMILNRSDKSALVAFLKTLTDNRYGSR